MNEHALRGDVWRKSSYSADSGACVEIIQSSQCLMAVRDSTDINGPRLFFTLGKWNKFTRELKSVERNILDACR